MVRKEIHLTCPSEIAAVQTLYRIWDNVKRGRSYYTEGFLGVPEVCLKNQLGSSQIVTLGQQYTARGNNPLKGLIYSAYSSVVFKLSYIYANMIITR